jgi:hypothetical protein
MKALNLPDKICDDLTNVAEELTFMSKKPISPSMAINLLIEVYHAHLSNRCALDAFSQKLQSSNIMSPQEFDKYWDEPIKPTVPKTKAKTKKQQQTNSLRKKQI